VLAAKTSGEADCDSLALTFRREERAMRRISFFLLPIALAASLGCGSSGNTGSGTGGGGTTTGGGGSMMAGNIPDPGTTDQVDSDFTDMEPNDTPQHATPLGTAMMGSLNVWVSSNTIGGSDQADYFVFKSGPTAGPFTFDICFNAPLTGMTATLWQVVGGKEQTPPVGTWTSTGMCVTNTPAGTPLVASTDYLFGLTATGASGSYSA
jgi:hypothetical protein